MVERIDATTEKSVVVQTGCGQKIFRRDDDGQIVYDEEGYIGGGGYPYVTLGRDIPANERDMKELLEGILPK
jgi:hypothetical protein